jgi:ankyrin repeat protein
MSLIGYPDPYHIMKLQGGSTALSIATAKGHGEVVELLLDFPGIDVNIADKVIFSLLVLARACCNAVWRILVKQVPHTAVITQVILFG